MTAGIKIIGISAAVPKEKLELLTLGDDYGAKYVKKVSRVTGVHTVRVAPANMTASDYCIEAAENLFKKINYDKNKIDALIFVTQSPDYMVPHTSAIMQHKLGLKNSIATFDLNFGCPGFVFGLFQAYSLINTGSIKSVLLCCGDTMTSKINHADKALKLIMGDGGSASIIERNNACSSDFEFFTDGSRFENLVVKAGYRRTPSQKGVTDVLLDDEDGNSRTMEDLYMNGVEVMNFALTDVIRTINTTLDKMSWSKDEVNRFFLHQANALIIQYIAKKLDVDIDKAPIGVSDIGNTSSASIPVMLCKIFGGTYTENMDKVIVCGFGTGLSCAVAALEMNGAYISNLVEI